MNFRVLNREDFVVDIYINSNLIKPFQTIILPFHRTKSKTVVSVAGVNKLLNPLYHRGFLSLGRGVNSDYIMSSCLYRRTLGKENFMTLDTSPRIGISCRKYRLDDIIVLLVCKRSL